MPAAPEQIHGVCGPETPVADVGVELLDGQFVRPGMSTLLMRIHQKNPLARRRIGDGLWSSPSTLQAQDSTAGLHWYM